jgi:DNA polymerase alpha subunit A
VRERGARLTHYDAPPPPPISKKYNPKAFFKKIILPTHSSPSTLSPLSSTNKQNSEIDLGEEDDWTKAQPGMSDDEGEDGEDGSAKKRKKGGKGGDGAGGDASKKAKPAVDKRDRQRLANMFAKNAAAVSQGGVKRKGAESLGAQEVAQDADALLEDILAGVGGGGGAAAAAPAAFAPRPPAAAVHRAPQQPMNQFRRPAPQQPPSVAATPSTVMKPDMHTPSAPRPGAAPVVRPARGVTFADDNLAAAAADDEYYIAPPLSPPSSQRDDDAADDAGAGAGGADDDDDAEDMDADDGPPSPAAVAAAAKRSILKGAAPDAAAAAAAAATVTASGCAMGTKVPAAPSATGDWAAVFDHSDPAAAGDEGALVADAAPATHADDGSLPLDANATLPFFLLDAHEDISAPGTVFLFGRVPVKAGEANGETVSACAVVTNMQRCMFAVPRPEAFADPEGEISALEDAAAAAGGGDDPAAARKAKGALLKCLQVKAADVKNEIRSMMLQRGIETFTMKPVKRSYCFERDDIPRGSQYVIKVRCSAASPALPGDLKGTHFVTILGTQAPMLEHLLVKSRVMGPSWIALHGASLVPQGQQKSWCKLEVNLGNAHKSVRPPANDGVTRDAPTLTVAALNLKTVVNHRANVNEIASASVVYVRNVRVDQPTPTVGGGCSC